MRVYDSDQLIRGSWQKVEAWSSAARQLLVRRSGVPWGVWVVSALAATVGAVAAVVGVWAVHSWFRSESPLHVPSE